MVKKTKDIQFYQGVGRRKEAIAVARLYIVGKDKTANIGELKIKQGEIYVNKKLIDKYFLLLQEKTQYLNPLKLTNVEERFAISITVSGGGHLGQLDAVIHALSRAIEKTDKDINRPILKAAGLLTRDSRIRQRRQVGTGGKARRQKQSPKR